MYLSIRVITLQNLELPFYCMCMSLNAYLFFFFCFGTITIFLVFSDIQPIDFCYWVDLENHLLIVNTKNDLPIIFGIFFVCTLLIDEPLAYHPFRFSFRLNQIHWFFKHIFLKCQISHEGNTFCWILCSLRNFCVSSNISYSAQYFFPTRIWPWIRVLFLPWILASSIFFSRYDLQRFFAISEVLQISMALFKSNFFVFSNCSFTVVYIWHSLYPFLNYQSMLEICTWNLIHTNKNHSKVASVVNHLKNMIMCNQCLNQPRKYNKSLRTCFFPWKTVLLLHYRHNSHRKVFPIFCVMLLLWDES